MKIYTKTGDEGKTSLFGGTRVPKHHIRIESYGTLDELNSHLGLVRDQQINSHYQNIIINIQDHLFNIGSHLATESNKLDKKKSFLPQLQAEMITQLENEIDIMNEALPPMTHFILPGGHPTVSYCHIARTICRRAERNISYLNEQEPLNPLILQYLNRLSDYLFVLARKLSFDVKAKEVKWVPKKG